MAKNTLVADAHSRTFEAAAILNCRVDTLNHGAAHGAYALIRLALQALSLANDPGASTDDCEQANSDLHSAIDVLRLVLPAVDNDRATAGALALLEMSRALIDQAIDEQITPVGA